MVVYSPSSSDYCLNQLLPNMNMHSQRIYIIERLLKRHCKKSVHICKKCPSRDKQDSIGAHFESKVHNRISFSKAFTISASKGSMAKRL